MENQQQNKKLTSLNPKILLISLLTIWGLVVIQLPLPFIDKSGGLIGIYLTLIVFILTIFAVKLLWKKESELKILSEVLISLIAINMVVKFTGGVYSHFGFLYFLPILFAATKLKPNLSTLVSVFASVILCLQLITVQTSAFSNAAGNLAILLFGIWLVTALGKTLEMQIAMIHRRQEELQVVQLKEIDKLKDEFVFIIAHELRSPITAIRGYLELISQEINPNLSESIKTLLEKSLTTSNRLADLVGLLLEIARLETGKIRFYFQKIDLKNSIDFVLTSLQTAQKQKKIQITNQVSSENFVLIDKERLEEIVKVVLENALNYTSEYGKILINSQTTEKEVILSIADTGVGISPDRLGKIFDKYYYQDEGSQVKVEGYGVSLYAAKQLLRWMKGDITCESIVGRGTTFNIRLPRYWSWGTSEDLTNV